MGNSYDLDTLVEREYQFLKMLKFLISRKVDYHDLNNNAELSIKKFLKTKPKQEELKALAVEYSKLSNSKRSFEKSHQEHFQDKLELFQISFTTYLSLGLVSRWPRYFYHPISKEVVFMREEIKVEKLELKKISYFKIIKVSQSCEP